MSGNVNEVIKEVNDLSLEYFTKNPKNDLEELTKISINIIKSFVVNPLND
jgi:hypothetical protein